ncbi:MAG: copper resistance protein CopC/CopD [Chloroflexota bacterium]|nr:copper resistance protein CopC/CopD [Chloroflexota bacterium]
MSIVFGETPDPKLSQVTVIDSSGSRVDAGSTAVVPGHPLELTLPLRPRLPNGVYTVRWRTVSTVDGHLAAGSFAFGVGVAVSSPAGASSATTSAGPTPAAVATRMLLYLGLIGVLGTVILGLFAFGMLPLPLRRVIVLGAAIALVGGLGVVVDQILAADVTASTLFQSSLGAALFARTLAALVLMAAALLQLRPQWSRPSAPAAGAAALVAMAIDVLNSHASAQSPALLNDLAQWLHIAAVGLWIGGLMALVVVLLRTPPEVRSDASRRLSTLAGIGLVVVAATGVFRAVVEIPSWTDLVTTTFGALVLVKVALLAILAALGAVNRWRNIPRLPGALDALRRVSSTEIVVGVATVAVAAALVNVAPPVEYAAASSLPSSVTVSASDYATTVKARLTVTPGRAGFNTFDLEVSDYDTGRRIAPRSVTLTLTQPFRPTLAASTLQLAPRSDGVAEGRGASLSLGGIWEIAAVVEYQDRSAELHFQLATIEQAPSVQAQKMGSGLPTLYTVPMSADVSAQIYLDPDKPGTGTLHVTYFDAGGNEARVPTTAIGMTPSGGTGTPTLLAARPFDPTGHYVANVTVGAGPTRFDVLATTASGQALATYLVITPGQ